MATEQNPSCDEVEAAVDALVEAYDHLIHERHVYETYAPEHQAIRRDYSADV